MGGNELFHCRLFFLVCPNENRFFWCVFVGGKGKSALGSFKIFERVKSDLTL